MIMVSFIMKGVQVQSGVGMTKEFEKNSGSRSCIYFIAHLYTYSPALINSWEVFT